MAKLVNRHGMAYVQYVDTRTPESDKGLSYTWNGEQQAVFSDEDAHNEPHDHSTGTRVTRTLTAWFDRQISTVEHTETAGATRKVRDISTLAAVDGSIAPAIDENVMQREFGVDARVRERRPVAKCLIEQHDELDLSSESHVCLCQ